MGYYRPALVIYSSESEKHPDAKTVENFPATRAQKTSQPCSSHTHPSPRHNQAHPHALKHPFPKTHSPPTLIKPHLFSHRHPPNHTQNPTSPRHTHSRFVHPILPLPSLTHQQKLSGPRLPQKHPNLSPSPPPPPTSIYYPYLPSTYPTYLPTYLPSPYRTDIHTYILLLLTLVCSSDDHHHH